MDFENPRVKEDTQDLACKLIAEFDRIEQSKSVLCGVAEAAVYVCSLVPWALHHPSSGDSLGLWLLTVCANGCLCWYQRGGCVICFSYSASAGRNFARGSVLIFLPGLPEIQAMTHKLQSEHTQLRSRSSFLSLIPVFNVSRFPYSIPLSPPTHVHAGWQSCNSIPASPVRIRDGSSSNQSVAIEK